MTRSRQAYYQEVRSKGLCGSCASRPAEPGYSRCQNCADLAAANRKSLKAARLCVSCKAQVEGLITTCDLCAEKERRSANMSRAQRKAAGLCADCGGEPRPNRTLCAECTKATALRSARHRKKCKKLGLCIKCGKLAMMGITLCVECRDKRIAYKRKDKRNLRDVQRKRRDEWTAAGLCRRCGQSAPVEGKKNCQKCIDTNSLYARVRRFRTKKPVKVP